MGRVSQPPSEEAPPLRAGEDVTEFPLELQGARLRLNRERPYLSHLLWSLMPRGTKEVPTLGVGFNGIIYYNPDYVATLSPKQLTGVMYHEMMHLLRDHKTRVPVEKMRGKFAADLEINDDIRDEGVELPPGCIYPDNPFDFPVHLSAEEYFDKLKDKEEDGSGDGSGGTDPSDKKGKGSGKGKKGQNPCSGGTGAAGELEGWEDQTKSEEGISNGEMNVIRRCVAEDIRKEAQAGRGTIPEHLKRWAESLLNPVVDWRKELAGAIRATVVQVAGMRDYSYSRPSRRQIPRVVLPSMRDPRPSVSVVADTSGSMGDNELKRVMAEIKGIIKSLGNQVTVLSVDAEVHSKKKVRNVKQVELLGGGGTDMRCGIEAALKDHPDIIVCASDGMTPWPETRPNNTRLVIVLIGEYEGATPKWARTIRVPTGKA